MGLGFFFPLFCFSDLEAHFFFFSNKRMCLLSLRLARRQRRSQCIEGREGRWLIEHSSHWKEIQAEGLPGLSEAPPSQRRQWDLLSDRVRILFPRNLVAGPQFLLSSSPVWGWAHTSGWASHAGVRMADTNEIQPDTHAGHIPEGLRGPRVSDGHPTTTHTGRLCAQWIEISSVSSPCHAMPCPRVSSQRGSRSEPKITSTINHQLPSNTAALFGDYGVPWMVGDI